MDYASPQEPLDYRELEAWDDDDVSPKSQPADRKKTGGYTQAQEEYNQRETAEINELPMLDDPPPISQYQQSNQQQHQDSYQNPYQDSYQDPYQSSYQQQSQQNSQPYDEQPPSAPITEPAQLIHNSIQPMDHAPQSDDYESWHDEDDISPMSHPVDRKQPGMGNQTQPPDPIIDEINSIPMLDDQPQQNSVPIISTPHPATYSQQPTTYDPQPATYNQQQTSYNQPPATYNQPSDTYNQLPDTYNQPPATYNQQQNGYSSSPTTYNQQQTDNTSQSNDHMQEPEDADYWHHDGELSPRSVPADRVKQNGYFPGDHLGDARTPLEANTPLEARTPLEPRTPRTPLEPRTPMEVQQKPLEDIEKIPALDLATEYSTEPELDTPIQHKFSVTSEMDQFSDASSYSEPDEPAHEPYKSHTYRLDLSDDDDDVETPLGIEAFTAMRKQRPEKIEPFMLTHPNGVSIFPTLTISEQEEMSKEALVEAEEHIVVDSSDHHRVDDGKSDAGYESDGATVQTMSVETSVRDYMFENGRRYHKFREGTYNFPNDDVEQEREDMKHAMVKLLCSQKLHFAPIGDHPQEVLDIGTGTGIWSIEMGDQYASANVMGVDLSPIQPEWVPPNVRFMIDDIESAWLYPRNSFDYIHARHTVMAIKDWMRLFRRAYEHIRPGGWIELQEIHHSPCSAGPNPLPADNLVAHYWSLINEGLSSLGVDFHAAAGGRLAAMMHEAGFVNITERVLHVPIGTWPRNKVLKTVGLYWRTILQDGIQAIALGPLTRGLGWSANEVELFLVDVRKAYNDNSTHMYMPFHVIYAQKPMDARL